MAETLQNESWRARWENVNIIMNTEYNYCMSNGDDGRSLKQGLMKKSLISFHYTY